ncbi:EF-P lysine aminoacylase EpmA [Thiomicrorhabdus cannonii]|uniref:EF-P lysine aminoacylase EpmA n=1 Tax=Thiomicrorhabdus cannonii TaxID=2748011 RepID=UPI0015B98206|nr:EF-P lysine aminoacylase EpmA [Thiomicrorhabdus cannonii]
MSELIQNPSDPACSVFSRLQKRAQLLQTLRAFFYARGVMEVDTPILSAGTVPDVHLRALSTLVQVPGERDRQRFYLHTSPEYPMKRLLSLGSGDIFYLGKVFRDGDLSRRHQVEFTMLEWYRLGFSLFELMDEVAEIIGQILGDGRRVEKLSYREAFELHAGIGDIFNATAGECKAVLDARGIEIVGVDDDDKPLWEQLVLTEVIEQQLGRHAITLLYHYPAREAALAQVPADNPLVAERFEAYVDGLELANGYRELADADAYRARFNEALATRQTLGLESVPLDEHLLQTLAATPLPDCSGVALGVDRLLMLQQGYTDIKDAMPFGLLEA